MGCGASCGAWRRHRAAIFAPKNHTAAMPPRMVEPTRMSPSTVDRPGLLEPVKVVIEPRCEIIDGIRDLLFLAVAQQFRPDVERASAARILIVGVVHDPFDRRDTPPSLGIKFVGTVKVGKAWSAPIAAIACAALERVLWERPAIGAAYLFPSAASVEKPASYEEAPRRLLEGSGSRRSAKQD